MVPKLRFFLVLTLLSPCEHFMAFIIHIGFVFAGVALLPFVDERRLLATLDTVYPDLSQDETRRNTYGCDNIFFSQYHPAYNFIKGIYEGFNPRRADKDKQVCNVILFLGSVLVAEDLSLGEYKVTQ